MRTDFVIKINWHPRGWWYTVSYIEDGKRVNVEGGEVTLTDTIKAVFNAVYPDINRVIGDAAKSDDKS